MSDGYNSTYDSDDIAPVAIDMGVIYLLVIKDFLIVFVLVGLAVYFLRSIKKLRKGV